ncbi:MAG: hypothetical protein AB7V43_03345 [Acidimicrobiia bacterium]
MNTPSEEMRHVTDDVATQSHPEVRPRPQLQLFAGLSGAMA